MQSDVIEEQIQIIVFSCNFDRILTSHKREALAKLQKEGTNVVHKPAMEFSLMFLGAIIKEVEIVFVLCGLLCRVAIWFRQCTRKVRDRFSLALVKVGVDVVNEGVAT